jgi:hypothetical protein
MKKSVESKAKKVELASVAKMDSVPPSTLNAGANALEKLAANVYHGNIHADIAGAYKADMAANAGKKKAEYPAMKKILPAFARKQKDQFTMLIKLMGQDPAKIRAAYDEKRATAKRDSVMKLSSLVAALKPKAEPASGSDTGSDSDSKAKGATFAARFAKAWDKLPEDVASLPALIELFDLRCEIE